MMFNVMTYRYRWEEINHYLNIEAEKASNIAKDLYGKKIKKLLKLRGQNYHQCLRSKQKVQDKLGFCYNESKKYMLSLPQMNAQTLNRSKCLSLIVQNTQVTPIDIPNEVKACSIEFIRKYMKNVDESLRQKQKQLKVQL